MTILMRLRRTAAAVLALAMFSLTFQGTLAQAAMVSTGDFLQQQQADYDRDQILQILAQDDTRRTLLSLGVNPEDVEQRVNNMTAEELAQFNAQAEQLPAGAASIFGVIIFALVLLIVLDLLGATDVFPAIRPIQIN